MRILIFLLASVYFLTAWPVSIKTEYDPKVHIYPQIDLTASAYPNEGIMLNWNTKSEENLIGFEIQRKIETEHFQSVGFVPAFGDQNGHHYTFIDQVNGSTEVIYRMKIVLEQSEILSQEFKIHLPR